MWQQLSHCPLCFQSRHRAGLCNMAGPADIWLGLQHHSQSGVDFLCRSAVV